MLSKGYESAREECGQAEPVLRCRIMWRTALQKNNTTNDEQMESYVVGDAGCNFNIANN
jgi:hypothetical protein